PKVGQPDAASLEIAMRWRDSSVAPEGGQGRRRAVGPGWLEHPTPAMSTSRIGSTTVHTWGICSTTVHSRTPRSRGLVRQLVRQPNVASETRKRAAGV